MATRIEVADTLSGYDESIGGICIRSRIEFCQTVMRDSVKMHSKLITPSSPMETCLAFVSPNSRNCMNRQIPSIVLAIAYPTINEIPPSKPCKIGGRGNSDGVSEEQKKNSPNAVDATEKDASNRDNHAVITSRIL